MGLRKYRYYFKKPKSEIVRDVFFWLAIAGAVAISATSPYFIQNLLKSNAKWSTYPKKKVQDTFHNLKRRGFISVENSNNQLYISLTEEGKRKAGVYQINNLQIPKPRHWDGKWRILVFDVQEMKKTYREALRGKLKQLGFFLMQKSVWIHPFDCRAEIELLRDFFGLSVQEMCLIVGDQVEDDGKAKRFFGLGE